ncbi:hypothetical protein [Streptomyces showdoensis]|uniref:Membrane protein n=1 Tax=Streptomyces showdoensis TaxID=68268 RepID=A0A2P2GE12_STREW|nr:hypothetical protein [Streptomyces showdoensis]KKZ69059.1 membrane protein [Streptomyces showdoensis]
MPDRQSTNDNNPFAPPPEGRPDQPWQPRRPEGAEGQDGGEGAQGPAGGPGWSSSQPGRSSDGFGRRPEQPSGGQGGGPGGPEGGQGPGLRWDPTDPAQRRARYAVLSGMWAFFFAIFNIPELALLLGALGLYWAISALRTRVKTPGTPANAANPAGPAHPDGPPTPAQVAAAAGAARSKRTSAVSGLVASAVALAIVASGFAMHLVYRDFYECRDDALTKQAQLACNDLLPKPLQDTFGVRE